MDADKEVEVEVDLGKSEEVGDEVTRRNWKEGATLSGEKMGVGAGAGAEADKMRKVEVETDTSY